MASSSSFRRALGAKLLAERIQEKNWNELEAARAAGIEPKTVRRIERGLNYQIEKLEKYALALGRPLEAWLQDVLGEAHGGVSSEERTVPQRAKAAAVHRRRRPRVAGR